MARLTKEALLNMANSPNADERKRAFKLYQAWIKANPTMPFQDRLNFTDRHLLQQTFTAKGMTMSGQPAARPAPSPRRKP